MKNSNIIIILIPIIFTLNSCMMGIEMSRGSMNSMMFGYSYPVQKINKGQVIEDLINVAITDLSKQNLSISTVAIWQIKSETAGIDTEMIKNLITERLINNTNLKVIARSQLDALLKEHSLYLSGTIDEKSAVEIGSLISVDGFMDGYIIIDNDNIILYLNLIETKTGLLIWAKTVEKPYNK
jgi:PBP1b-binding outer membrane lipoprotein LpoB